MLYKFNQKKCAFMKSFDGNPPFPLNSPRKAWLSPVKYQRQTHQKPNLSFSINPDSKQAKQINQDIEKFSMAQLCKSFLNKHNNQENHTFTSQELLTDFKVKQRRLYDLMNILEGCGCVGRISKGTYLWYGEQKPITEVLEGQNGDPTSLRQISARLKLILFKSDKPLSFNQLNLLLLDKESQKQINPASIRRRIYECCKVFTLLGYMSKTGKLYYSTFNNINSPVQIVPHKKTEQKVFRLESTQKKLINQILKKYKTLQQIQEFTRIVKQAYEQKNKKIKIQ